MKILMIAGTRPNFIKLAPLYHELKKYASFSLFTCHTGQHFDLNMSDIIWKSLCIPDPDFQLNISGINVADTIGKTIIELNKLFAVHSFDIVIVFGDVSATAAGAIAAAHNRIPLAHVEAGLRSFDREMPEELNRIVTDHLSQYLFVSEQSGMDNLSNEGFSPERIFFVGNIMIENLIRTRENWNKISFPPLVQAFLNSRPIIATFHRPENVDDKNKLERLLQILETLSLYRKVIFPVHPRTKNRLSQNGLEEKLSGNENILTVEPMGYLEFIKLISSSSLVITDSGGIQEETSFLNIPCVTFRKNTERPVTIELGTNKLISLDSPDFEEMIGLHVNAVQSREALSIPLWDDGVSKRIAEILLLIKDNNQF